MSKRRGAGRCVYCLGDFEVLTSDHVIPRSWFSESTPANVELPQAPSCLKCNVHWGTVETSLRERLGFAIEPYILGGEGVGDRSLRAIDPAQAKSSKDREKRAKKQERFRTRLRRTKTLPTRGVFPNIGQIAPSLKDDYLVDEIDGRVIDDVVRKWITGLTYHFNKMYIDPAVYVVESKVGRTPPSWFLKAGLWHKTEIGPGMIIDRRTAADDPIVSFYVFSIWGKFEFSGAIVRLDYILNVAADRVFGSW